jgi:hypothetical protein
MTREFEPIGGNTMRVKRAAAKPVPKRPAAPASSGKPATEDRKLLSVRLKYAQLRHLQRMAFNAEPCDIYNIPAVGAVAGAINYLDITTGLTLGFAEQL